MSRLDDVTFVSRLDDVTLVSRLDDVTLSLHLVRSGGRVVSQGTSYRRE